MPRLPKPNMALHWWFLGHLRPGLECCISLVDSVRLWYFIVSYIKSKSLRSIPQWEVTTKRVRTETGWSPFQASPTPIRWRGKFMRYQPVMSMPQQTLQEWCKTGGESEPMNGKDEPSPVHISIRVWAIRVGTNIETFAENLVNLWGISAVYIAVRETHDVSARHMHPTRNTLFSSGLHSEMIIPAARSICDFFILKSLVEIRIKHPLFVCNFTFFIMADSFICFSFFSVSLCRASCLLW